MEKYANSHKTAKLQLQNQLKVHPQKVNPVF